MLRTNLKAAGLAAVLGLAAVAAHASEDNAMKRTSINPVTWGAAFAMDQGQVTEGTGRVLRMSGQVALQEDPDSEMGVSVTSAGDLRGQMQDALANVDAVLSEAGMGREDIVHIHFFTTDIDGFLQNYDVYMEWIGPSGGTPPQSLLGVNRLVLPELMVEIEVTAAQ